MKKLLTLLLTLLMVLSLAGCASKKEEAKEVINEQVIQEEVIVEEIKEENTAEELVGGFIEVEDRTLTDELKEIFNKAYEGYTGMSLEPVELYQTQVVAGINYKFVCSGTKTTNPPIHGTYFVTVYKDLQGNCSIIDIETITEGGDVDGDISQYKYWVVFYDQYGNELQRTKEDYGTIPSFKGELPNNFKAWINKKTGKQVNIFNAIHENMYFEAIQNSGSNITSYVKQKETITYLDENGLSQNVEIVEDTVLTIDIGDNGYWPVGTFNNNQITVVKNNPIDLTDSYYKPEKVDYIFVGYQFDSSLNKFTAQYKEKPSIKYADKNRIEQIVHVDIGTVITIDPNSCGTISGATQVTMIDGSSLDLTSSDYIPIISAESNHPNVFKERKAYEFFGYQFDSSTNTFKVYYLYVIKIVDFDFLYSEPGMTWGEWFVSSYNTTDLECDNTIYRFKTGETLFCEGTIGDEGLIYSNLPVRAGGYFWKNNNCCFDAGSQVLMADETTKNIEDVVVGDMVMSLNEETMEYVPQKVKGTIINQKSTDLVYVNLSNGIQIGMRAYHPLLTTEGWKSLRPRLAQTTMDVGYDIELLNVGDEIIGINGNVKITSIINRPEIENYKTYNLSIEGYHNYIVDGVVVHNAASPC